MPKRAKENTPSAAAPLPAPEPAYSRPDSPDLKKPTIAEIFGPGGAIEKCMPAGYEHRRSQREMAELVEGAPGTADLPGHLGQAVRAQEDDGDDADHEQLAWVEIQHAPSLYGATTRTG